MPVLLFPVLVFWVEPCFAQSEDPPTIRQLLESDDTSSNCRAVKHVVDSQSNPVLKEVVRPSKGDAFERVERRVFMMKWFRSGGRIAIRYWVNDQLDAWSVRQVFNWANQATTRKTLSRDQMRRICQLASSLPKSTADPPIDQAVVVNYQDASEWRTAIYDATALPEELERILLILGERFETKSRHQSKVHP